MDIFGFNGQTAFVLGLGVTGVGTAKALLVAGVHVVGWDDNAAARAEAEQYFPLVNPAGQNWQGVGGLLKSPGIPLEHPTVQQALAAGVKLLSDFDLLARREAGRPVQFIGVTGTNGKSTVTSQIGHILAQNGVPVAVGGNIGRAALELPVLPAGGVYVLECSSYQLEMTTELAVDAGVVLNLTPDHLARHGTMEAYRDIKLSLLRNANPGALKLVGADQPLLLLGAQAVPGGSVKEAAALATMQTLAGPAAETAATRDADYRVDADGKLWWQGDAKAPLADLSVFAQLPGAHNWQNMAAAIVLTRRWVELPGILAALATFRPLPHRLEPVDDIDGVRFVNDSKATNGDSTVPALRAFTNIYWIVGGAAKSDGLGPTVHALQNVRAAFTIGEAGPAFGEELERLGVPVTACGTMAKAVQAAFGAATADGGPDNTVLLSPACASYDQYKNFEERGADFVCCVGRIRQD